MHEIEADLLAKRFAQFLKQLGPEGAIVTRRGKPIARLVPIADTGVGDCADLIGCMKGQIRVKGSLYSTGLRWNAER
jgi:antitoxin (DNA-binding transcriptional repressor) of toxin-antitoxin stability system